MSDTIFELAPSLDKGHGLSYLEKTVQTVTLLDMGRRNIATCTMRLPVVMGRKHIRRDFYG